MAQRESAMSPVGSPPWGPFGPGTPSHSHLVPREPIRLVIAEGHQIVRLGLERFLGSIEDFSVVATATDGPESLAAVRAHAPDVVVLDIRLSGKSGLEVARDILKEGLPTRIVLVPEAIDDGESLEAGRQAFLQNIARDFEPAL